MFIRKIWFYKTEFFLERDLKEGVNEYELNKYYLGKFEKEVANRLDRYSENKEINQFESDAEKIYKEKYIVFLETYIQKIRPIIERKYE